MDGIRIVFFVIAALIIIINFFINSANIISIITYCFRTNTLDKYWETFFKNCVSAKSIISSVIGFVVAFILFFIIAPFILYRKARFGSSQSGKLQRDLVFQYRDQNLEKEDRRFYSNFSRQTGLQSIEIDVSGKIRIDAIIAISKIEEACKSSEKKFDFKVMETIKLEDKKEILVPILISIDSKKIPVFFLYENTHHEQFQKVRSILLECNYDKCIYFSMDRPFLFK